VALAAPAAPAAAKIYGLDFGPYLGGQGPANDPFVSERQIRQRLELIAPYAKWVRTYGCGGGLARTGAVGRRLGIRVALGAWIDRDPAQNEVEIACLIRRIRAGEVNLAIVGSEALLRRDVTPAALVGYIDQVKRATAGSGVPVASADEYSQLLANPSVMAASDILLPNIYPYFAGVDAAHAVAQVAADYRVLKAAAPGKEIRISETGWPSCGVPVGRAVPSGRNAAAFFSAFEGWARSAAVKSFYFEAFDESWKAGTEGAAGACLGIARASGVLKPGMWRVFAPQRPGRAQSAVVAGSISSSRSTMSGAYRVNRP
jgi:exo-beta-1,3-glucanase (GH17 family)